MRSKIARMLLLCLRMGEPSSYDLNILALQCHQEKRAIEEKNRKLHEEKDMDGMMCQRSLVCRCHDPKFIAPDFLFLILK